MSKQHAGLRGRVPGYLARLAVVGVVVAGSAALVAEPASANRLSRRQARKVEAIVSRATKPGHTSLANGRTLGALTSQGDPLVATVAKNGKTLGVVVTAIQVTCTSGDQLVMLAGWAGVSVGPGGSVSKTLQIPPSAGSGGVTITGGSSTMSGKLDRKKATFTGTWDVQFGLTLPDGTPDQCDSGHVAFKAAL